MFLQFAFIFGASIIMLALLALIVIKAGLQLKYKRLQEGKKPTSISEFIQFDYSDAKERGERWQAFLLFPLTYTVVLDDDREDLLQIKKKIKRIHLALYGFLIILIIMGIYSEKVFPQNA